MTFSLAKIETGKSMVEYCGLLCCGCPGKRPCDYLDTCYMKHDAYTQAKNNYKNLLNCMTNFKKLGGRTFEGSKCQVEDVVNILCVVMEATLLAGRYLHKP
ncbi:hypothetical protein EUGRSUZ_C00463 [Eucalyptus grandis]|uniref:Uncharacterized protein n=2 Tax=Eucalyptus grandis TaxID=71139 RepID=A0ACC3LA39_EUCGR|nr:hypothetical protein EUGRSUZ_C00463 [Eucalyptus grandis]